MKQPILVTGSHRSGSTWVGKMLSLSPKLGYISEPFNPNYSIGYLRLFRKWFTYVTEENEADYYAYISQTIAFHYKFRASVLFERPLAIKAIVTNWGKFTYYRLTKKIPLIKDPIAVFSSPWIAKRFNAKVVFLIRHPAAFAGSLKVKDWQYPFDDFLTQPLLMQDYLHPFESAIRLYTESPQDIIDQAVLLWRCIYGTGRLFQAEHPDWLFYRYEDIARDPSAAFEKLYGELGLEFTPQIAKKIQSRSVADIFNWKSRLSKDEIDRVKSQTADIWPDFYMEEDW